MQNAEYTGSMCKGQGGSEAGVTVLPGGWAYREEVTLNKSEQGTQSHRVLQVPGHSGQ